jgi:hypothetical protein
MSQVDNLRCYILKIHFNNIHLGLGLQSGLFFKVFIPKLGMHFSLMFATFVSTFFEAK